MQKKLFPRMISRKKSKNYFSGDAARRDQDGHYYITGHVDDAINVKGVSIGPNEIEDEIVRVKGIPSFVDCLSQIETPVILE